MAGESEGHKQLKRGAYVWAQIHDYVACAEEVRLPKSNYRADVVGCKKGNGDKPGHTAILECKWSRADLMGHSASLNGSQQRLAELQQRLEVLERNLSIHHPGLRAGETLFPEFDIYDLDGIEHSSYQAVTREIQVMQRRIRSGSKFDRIARYRCADLCYLVIKDGICQPEELPPGWGVLKWDGETTMPPFDEDEPDPEIPKLELEKRPVKVDCSDADRFMMLQRVAAVATRLGNQKFGVPFGLSYLERQRR